MKNLTILILLTCCFLEGFTQKYVDTNDPKNEEIKSLLSKGNDLNGFGGADLRVGDFKDERGLLVGAYGGLIINRRYLFGVAGYGLVTNVEFDGLVPGQTEEKKLNLHGGYGGVIIGASIAPKELVHISIPILLGAGSFEVVDKNFFVNNLPDSEFTIENTVFFVVEPAIELEFNISATFRLGFGASYRYITGTELVNIRDEDVTGASGMISLRFGRF
ncbi:MAG: hypothetical protein RIM99_03305 [Cyclobacteriaceae bacterium]